MKAIFFLFLLVASFQASCQLKSVTVQVSGLTCALCSKAVQKSLQKISFVKEVKPDLNTQEYQLIFRGDNGVSLDEIKKEIEDAGFSVARLQVTASFAAVNVQKNAPIKIGTLLFHFLNSEADILKGERTFTVVEKDFLTTKAFKKYCNDPQRKCGVNESSSTGARIYKAVI